MPIVGFGIWKVPRDVCADQGMQFEASVLGNPR